jgi:hypothetical protein
VPIEAPVMAKPTASVIIFDLELMTLPPFQRYDENRSQTAEEYKRSLNSP